jgi:aryl-alcohol dehydrogenase-like predicted oxidoreductase
MEHRFVGRSGLKVSALTFGNWLTQGGERDREIAERCIATALDLGITSFDTADTYANGAAEECLGAALKRQRRESLVVMSKVYFPAVAAPRGENEVGLSRKHIIEGINGTLRRLGMDYVDIYQAHRYDRFTPLEETMQAFADVVRAGKALYIGVSEWTPEALRQGQALARELGISLISNQPQYSMLWRVIEREVVPTCEDIGMSQMVWSPYGAGSALGQIPSWSGRAARLAGARHGERWRQHDQALDDRQRAASCASATAAGGRARHFDVANGARLGAQEPERRDGHHRRLETRTDSGERGGGRG